VDDGQFRFRQFVSTMLGCMEKDKDEEESRFVAAMEGVARWRMEGEALVLEGDKSILRFLPAQ
jgi:heat shock protein HslJ